MLKVRILVDGHEHAGEPVLKGSVIEVDELTAQWLVDNHLGELVA